MFSYDHRAVLHKYCEAELRHLALVGTNSTSSSGNSNNNNNNHHHQPHFGRQHSAGVRARTELCTSRGLNVHKVVEFILSLRATTDH